MSKTLPSFPTVSAIVVTFRSGAEVKECLYALLGEPGITEIIIVDNGNDERIESWLEEFASKHADRGCKRFVGHGNIGFGSAVNLGARAATGERLLLINPDAVLHRYSLPPLEAARQGRKSPCLVGGRLIYPTGNEQRGCRRELLTLPRAIVSFSGLSKLEGLIPAFRDLHREHDEPPKGPTPMPVVSGAFGYISTDDFNHIGGFDEAFFLHVEDIDLCRRIGEAGGEVIYTPDAVVMHYGSTSEVSAVFVQWHKAKGLSRYFRKYATSPFERFIAWASLYLFTILLVGRSYFIQSLWWANRQIVGLRRIFGGS